MPLKFSYPNLAAQFLKVKFVLLNINLFVTCLDQNRACLQV